MKFLKVKAKDAEKAKRRLTEENALDHSFKIRRSKDFVFLPLSKSMKAEDGIVVELEGEKITRKPKSLKDALEGNLPQDELRLLPSAFDIIGDIAILDLPDELAGKKALIAEALLKAFSNIKVVCLKESKVDTEYRVPGIKWAAGEKRTETVHKEHGCLLKLDVSKVYFTPRLGGERMRVVSQIRDGEKVLVLFAGVGPYAILAAKKRKCITTAVELNPAAVEYMKENVKLNRVVNVQVMEGDVRTVLPKMNEKFDRIIMPLPKQADTFLDVTLPRLAEDGIIHYYTFAKDTDEAVAHLSKVLEGTSARPEILAAVFCGSYSPAVSRICVDFKLK